MSLVKVKTKGQVTIPTAIRELAGLAVGDLLEAKLEAGKITLKPKFVVDRDIDEGLEDVRKGRVYGPFNTARELAASFKANMKTKARAKKFSHSK